MSERTVDMTEVDKTFYVHYGRAMANWAQLENSLSGIFSRITKMEGRLSTEVFYSARSFLGRADMVAACVPFARTVPAGREFLTGSIRRAKNYAGFRNRLAHNMHVLDMRDRRGSQGNVIRRVQSGIAGPDYGPEEVETAGLNFAHLAILNMVSLGERKLFREPELSLALLELLPADAGDAQKDPTAVSKRISEIASLPG